ncbi:unnamed protein product [Mucor circinelloides]
MGNIDTEHNDANSTGRNTPVNSGNPSSVTYGGSTDKTFNETKMESLQSSTGEKDVESTFSASEADVDGGYGWFVCLGAFCAQFVSFGVLFSW